MSESGSTKPGAAIYGVGQYGQYPVRLASEKGWPVAAACNRAAAPDTNSSALIQTAKPAG